jgi:hypothetical protein
VDACMHWRAQSLMVSTPLCSLLASWKNDLEGTLC